MQAIITKYYGPTNSRGSRIKASCERGTIWFPYPHEISGTENVHRAAVAALIKKFVEEDFREREIPAIANSWNCMEYASGQIRDGEYAHVFIEVSY